MSYLATLYGHITKTIGTTIVGLEEPLRELLVGLVTSGHVLLEGPPGTGKTLLAKALARSLDLRFSRIQFTPDLMPADVVGTSIYDPSSQSFRFREGPIFTDVLLADEINRTPPKTQAALLEAMEERQATVDGQSHPLSPHFFVVATQNPIEYEGTYPLPEAQVDRFLMKVIVPYPDRAGDVEILRRHLARPGSMEPAEAEPRAIERDAIEADLRGVNVADGILDYVAAILHTTRDEDRTLLGASPRAGVALVHASRALAALAGREFVTPDDVKRMALPVLRHRLVLRPESEMEGLDASRLIEETLTTVPVPR